MGDNFADNIGLILGVVLLILVFLLIGRGRGRDRLEKWRKPGKPDRPEGYGRKRFVQARGPNREKKRDKREGGKPEKRGDHPDHKRGK